MPGAVTESLSARLLYALFFSSLQLSPHWPGVDPLAVYHYYPPHPVAEISASRSTESEILHWKSAYVRLPVITSTSGYLRSNISMSFSLTALNSAKF